MAARALLRYFAILTVIPFVPQYGEDLGRPGPTSRTLTGVCGEMGTSPASPADKCFEASSAAQLLPGRDPWQLLGMGIRCPGPLLS